MYLSTDQVPEPVPSTTRLLKSNIIYVSYNVSTKQNCPLWLSSYPSHSFPYNHVQCSNTAVFPTLATYSTGFIIITQSNCIGMDWSCRLQ